MELFNDEINHLVVALRDTQLALKETLIKLEAEQRERKEQEEGEAASDSARGN